MASININASSWKLVEIGRVVLLRGGPHAGKIAVIAQIVDHKRVLVDGPSTQQDKVVPRHVAALSHINLTALTIPKFPLAAGTGAIRKLWAKNEIDAKWANSSYSKKTEQANRRRALTDFERFKVMKLRKQARFEVAKANAKLHASA